MQKPIKVNLPIAAIKKIDQLIGEYGIFEDRESFILHAITDLLEQHK